MAVNLDAQIENADWIKLTWDLPPIGSEELNSYLESVGMKVEELRAYKLALRIPKVDGTWLVRGEDGKLHEEK